MHPIHSQEAKRIANEHLTKSNITFSGFTLDCVLSIIVQVKYIIQFILTFKMFPVILIQFEFLLLSRRIKTVEHSLV